MSPLGMFGPRSGHKPLFVDLCRFHDLDRKTKLLLKDIVLKFNMERPAELFVDSTHLRRAIENPAFAESLEDLQELYKSWFGDT